MKAVFWGTRGSLPASFSTADLRLKLKDVLNYVLNDSSFSKKEIPLEQYISAHLPTALTTTCGTNTACIEFDSGKENEYILCDAGTGLRDFAFSYAKSGRLRNPACFHLFLTHLHWDHIQGFPFFIPAYVPGNTIIIHGYHYNIEENFKKQMNPPCFPVPLEALDAKIVFDIKMPWEVFDVCGYKIQSIQQNHPGISFGYRFEKNGKAIVYSTDCEHTENAHEEGYPFINFFKNADVLIFDAMYSLADASIMKANWGHSNNLMGVKLAAKSQVKHLILFHHEPTRGDQELDKFLQNTVKYAEIYHKERQAEDPIFPNKVSLAYDGMVLEI